MFRSPELSDSKKQAIKTALQEYCQNIYERNLAELKYYVQSVEQQQAPLGFSNEAADMLRLDTLSNLLSCNIPEFISVPSDLIKQENLELLRTSLELNGVQPIPYGGVLEEYIVRRENYLSVLDHELQKKTISEYQGTLSVPTELQYLMELCDAVEGPGLGQYRYTEGYTFLSRLHCNDDGGREIRARVFKLNRKGKLKWPCSESGQWEAAAGFRCGNGANSPGGGFAVFCRSEEEELPWAWRYGLEFTDKDTSDDLHDDIPGFLTFYKHFEESFLNDFQAPRVFR